MSSDLHDQRLMQAAHWRNRLSELGADTTPEFEAWLREPVNREAWEQVSAPWDFLGEHRGAPEAAAARRAALQDARDAAAGPARSRRRLGFGIAAALLLAVAGWGTLQWRAATQDYATARGERRIITLADGSRVSLDSSTEVTVRYTGSARQLALLRGQARFDVAHDVERPFSVLAGGQKVIATGTVFNIDLTGRRVLVTLIEGHVVVVDEKSRAQTDMPLAARPKALELTAGQLLTLRPNKAPDITPANIQRITAWMNGQLVFENETLSDVVQKVNRYTATPIEIRDPKVAAMRISGVFNTGDLTGVLDIITHYLPVTAVDSTNGAVVLERKRRMGTAN
jgi:transmembrane sensor